MIVPTYDRVVDMNMQCYDSLTDSVSSIGSGAVVEMTRNGYEETYNTPFCHIPCSVIVSGQRVWYLYCSFHSHSFRTVSIIHTASDGTQTTTSYDRYRTTGDDKLYRYHSTDGVSWSSDGIGDFWQGTTPSETKIVTYQFPTLILPSKKISIT